MERCYGGKRLDLAKQPVYEIGPFGPQFLQLPKVPVSVFPATEIL